MWSTVFRALLRGVMRERITLFWSMVFPVVLMIGLGQAFPEEAYHQSLFGGALLMSAIFFATSGTAFLVLGQRRQGVYKLLRATPFTTSSFVSALTAARFVVSLACLILLAFLGAWILSQSLLLGAFLWLGFVLTLALLGFTLLGFAFGNLASNEGQAAALNNLVNLPLLFASSALYSLESAPSWLQAISKVLPFEAFLRATRAALVDEPSRILSSLPAMLGFIGFAGALAVLTFRWDPAAPIGLRCKKG